MKHFFNFVGINKKVKSPWQTYYKNDEMNIIVPNKTIYHYLKKSSVKNKDKIAIEYFGRKYSYKELLFEVDKCANAFKSLGIRSNDVITILSANIPEALISFYALNKIGAIVNFLHPLLSENEIKDALCSYSTVMILAMDITYPKLKNIIKDTEVYKVIILSAKDSMPNLMKIGYQITKGHIIEKTKKNDLFIYWKDFINYGKNYDDIKNENSKKDTPAVILQSGGTTGKPKGIVLSNGNFNASTIQAMKALPDLSSDDSILGIMPLFHGFGLQVSINNALMIGAKVILIPTFKSKSFHKLLNKYKPTVLVGVPTLFEALTHNEKMKNINLSNLKYVIAGGDTLNKEKVESINKFLHEHGAKTNFTQGYGLTEAVAAVSMDLKYASRLESVGIPWPGTYIKICKIGTDDEVAYGEEGEICISGPTVMLGYYNNEKETNESLHIHKDGNIWLHSGDIGTMDKDGFITYKSRIKRMIITSGYNVYPSQIEEILLKHEAVLDASVIGIPHSYKINVPKAFITLKNGYKETNKLRQELMQLCQKNLAKYAIPYELEIRKNLPKTIIGKIDFLKLQQENIEKRRTMNETKK